MLNVSSKDPVPNNEASTEAAVPDRQRFAPWSGLGALLGTLGIFLASQTIAYALISAVLAATQFQTGRQASLQTVGMQFLFVLLIEALTVGGVWALVGRRRGWRQGLGLVRPALSDVWVVAIGAVVYFVSLTLVTYIVPLLVPIDVAQKQALGFNHAQGVGSLALVFMSLVILPPIAEEILVRGYLYGGLRNRLQPWSAGILASMLFGAGHLFGGEAGKGLLWIAGLDTFVLSLVLCQVRERTGSLGACMAIHALKNGIAFVLLFGLRMA